MRREHNLIAFRRGLTALGVVELIQCHPNLTKTLLVADEKTSMLTSEQFIQLIGSLKPIDPEEYQSYKKFMTFIHYIENGKHH